MKTVLLGVSVSGIHALTHQERLVTAADQCAAIKYFTDGSKFSQMDTCATPATGAPDVGDLCSDASTPGLRSQWWNAQGAVQCTKADKDTKPLCKCPLMKDFATPIVAGTNRPTATDKTTPTTCICTLMKDTGCSTAEIPTGCTAGSGSTPPDDSSKGEDKSSCFSGDSMVVRKDGGQVPLRDIKIGDYLLGSSGFEPVVGFLHNSSTPTSMLKIVHSAGAIEVSPSHFVFLADGSSVKSSSVEPGMTLASAQGEPRVVSEVQSVPVDSFHAPLTRSGTIEVGGVVFSNYVNTHWISHAALAPARILGVAAGAAPAHAAPVPVSVSA